MSSDVVDRFADRRCCHILPKKNRRCRMLVKTGNIYCGEHSIYVNDTINDRIQCPFDSRHTVSLSVIDEHLRYRCNSRLRTDNHRWICENINTNQLLNNTTDDELIQIEDMIDRIEVTFELVIGQINNDYANTSIIDEHLQMHPEYGVNQRKHLLQLSSIIGHLHKNNLLDNNSYQCSIVEFGAGKARCSYWLTKLVPNCHFLLIDRSGCRNKFDNRGMQENVDVRMTRLNCAIEHLDLQYVESIQSSDYLVAVCKHLCGSATDYTIRCLQNAINNANIKFNGFVFAPCCHHRCTYNQYVGKDQLYQLKLVTSEQQFNILKHISTWAVCGFRPVLSIENQQQQLSYEDERKTIVGQKAKALIEFGRMQYLIDQMGFRVNLCRYIDASVSPENLLIVGINRDYISTANKG